MCGIVILLDPNRFVDPKDTLNSALAAIAHRGLPGRAGVFCGDAYLGHVRLPIRGLSTEYDQPYVTSNHVSMYVGEMFGIDVENDTEYAMELLDRDPEELTLQDGFWNLVRHDRRTGRTQVFMDHLAIKPLYWHQTTGVICSELRGIEAVVKGLRLDHHYLSNVRKWGYDPRGDTPYEGVQKLRAGYCYTFEGIRLIRAYRYFSLKPRATIDLKMAIIKATRDRLVSDLPLAVLCSGGLDSTIVALLAAQTAHKMTVFHVDNDESTFVDLIPWPAHVEVIKIPLEPASLQDALLATEEPVDLGSVLPQYQLGQAIRKAGFNVVLSGDGADELFGGYRRAKEYDSQFSDVFTELVNYHLPRLDKTMMASTVELRSPFLAPNVVRGALALPWSVRTEKQVLKALFEDFVPRRILDRPKKALRSTEITPEYRNKIVEDFVKRKTSDSSRSGIPQEVRSSDR